MGKRENSVILREPRELANTAVHSCKERTARGGGGEPT